MGRTTIGGRAAVDIIRRKFRGGCLLNDYRLSCGCGETVGGGSIRRAFTEVII